MIKTDNFSKYKNFIFFYLFLIFFLFLALFFHKDVIFNPYNYGRHWDWSMYASADFYRNYLHSFFFSLNDNSLGYYTLSSLAEFLLKSSIFLLYSFFSFIGLHVITIPILNKITIFVVFPLIASSGIWFLCKKILSKIFEKKFSYFFLIAVFCNLLYTFSLTLIFDLHGGALNRQIASVFFPFFFAVLFDYFTNKEIRFIDKRLINLSLFFIFFDISNIFYFSVIVTFAIIFKEVSIRFKIVHFAIFSFLLVLFNLYWLHSLVFGNVVNVTKIVQLRKLDFKILASYSSSYINNLFLLSTPHNLINRTFGTNPLIYITYFFLYFLIFFNLLQIKRRVQKMMLILPLTAYILSTILTNGVLGITPIYQFLYSIPYLAFIEGAVRYMPNLLIVVIFFFLITVREVIQNNISGIRIYKLILIPVFAWLIFLLTHANLIYEVNKNVNKSSAINDEIGALYQYDNALNIKLNKERLVYNVLPIPSFNSPYFIDNIYPKTSQGSDTDSYFSKGFIYTNGVPSDITSFFNSFINTVPDNYFYSLTNTKYILFKTTLLNYDQLKSNVSFTYDWIYKKNLNEDIKKAINQKNLYKIPPQFFLSKLYTTINFQTVNQPISSLPFLINKDAPQKKLVFFFQSQNPYSKLSLLKNIPSGQDENKLPVVEFKKISSAKYRVIVHHATTSFPLIFSETYYQGWKAYVAPINRSSTNINLTSYKILSDNEDDQATRTEVETYKQNGWLSSSGINSAGFISKNFKGTVQNDNLPNGSLFETWGKKSLPDDTHLEANGFANAWIISPDKLCVSSNNCVRNSDGSYDIFLLLEFAPQKSFYISLFASSITLLTCIIYLSLKHGFFLH